VGATSRIRSSGLCCTCCSIGGITAGRQVGEQQARDAETRGVAQERLDP
jgi:hypothetical protein